MNVLGCGGEPVTWLVVMQQVQHGGVQVKACSMMLGESGFQWRLAQHSTTTNKLLTVTIKSNRPAHTSIHLKDAQRLCWISVQVRVAIGGWKRWWAAPLSEADYTSPPSWAAAECRPGRVAIRTHLCFEASWVCDTEIIKHTQRRTRRSSCCFCDHVCPTVKNTLNLKYRGTNWHITLDVWCLAAWNWPF